LVAFNGSFLATLSMIAAITTAITTSITVFTTTIAAAASIMIPTVTRKEATGKQAREYNKHCHLKLERFFHFEVPFGSYYLSSGTPFCSTKDNRSIDASLYDAPLSRIHFSKKYLHQRINVLTGLTMDGSKGMY
jgi:hypothetical protein